MTTKDKATSFNLRGFLKNLWNFFRHGIINYVTGHGNVSTNVSGEHVVFQGERRNEANQIANVIVNVIEITDKHAKKITEQTGKPCLISVHDLKGLINIACMNITDAKGVPIKEAMDRLLGNTVWAMPEGEKNVIERKVFSCGAAHILAGVCRMPGDTECR